MSGTSGNASSGGTGGTGGGTAGTSDLTTMVFGGGGGGHAERNGSGGLTNGGGGGGIVFVTGATVSVTGAINVNGGNAGTGAGGQAGGAGAGGSLLMKAQTATLGSSLLTASAGTGVAGGAGRIRVEYENSLSGTTSPTASTAQTTIPLLPEGVVPTIISTDYYETPDSAAKYTEYEYDVLGRVQMVTSPDGDMRTTAYDHWKVTNIDEKGAIKRNFLNAFDKIAKVEEVLGATTSATLYTYNARDDLTQITDDKENDFDFVYDTLGRKTSQTDPDMGTWSYGYDAVGNLTSTTDARSVTTTRTYDELNRLTTVNYPTDNDTSYSYDLGKIGTLSIATDSAGTVAYTYDNRLRKTQEARTIGGTTKSTSFAYDALDRLTSQTNPDNEAVNYSFNNQGEIESATGSASLVSNFDYNALGKITKKDFGNGVTTNYTYNTDDFRLNRIQTASLFDKNYTYDEVGNIATITDNLISKVQTFGYDDLDRLTSASESAGFDYEYEYNSIGNLTKFINAGIDTNYTYGSGSAYIKPHALTAVSGTASSSATYEFYKGVNFNGNAVTIEGNSWQSWGTAQSNGMSVPSGYYSANTSVTPNPAGETDTSGVMNSAIWKENAPLTINQTLTNGNYQVYFWIMENYQSHTRKIDVELENNQVADDIGYLSYGNWVKYGPYDVTVSDGTLNVELINAMDSPHVMGMAIYQETTGESSIVTGYLSDQDGTEVANGWGPIEKNKSNGENSAGDGNTITIQSTTYTKGLGAHAYSEITYEVAGECTSFTAQVGVDDEVGSNGSVVFQVWGDSIKIYDSGTKTGNDGASSVNVSLTGVNILKLIITDAGNGNGYDHADWANAYITCAESSENTTYTYDNNGNMLTDGLKLFEYNEANQLKTVKLASNSATIAEYVYDFNGNRMVKKNYNNGVLANTVYSWSDSFETKVIEGGATETTVYYFANKELVAKKKNDGSMNYVHTDHLGSTSVVTNSGGSLVEATSYDPWGEVLAGGTASKFGYTGQEHDSETGLKYYNARYYNSDIRRFTQPDDIIQNIYNPQSLNRYSYVHNNPLRYTDPSGNFSIGTLFDIYKITKFVSNLFKAPETQKKTEAKTNTNNNNNNKQNTSSNQSGSNNNKGSVLGGNSGSSSSTGNSTSLTNYLPKTTDVSISSGVFGPVGGGFGIQGNTKGFAPYASGGFVTPGKGVAALFSNNDIKPNSNTMSFSGTAIGSTSWSWPFDPEDRFVTFSEMDKAWGVGFPAGVAYTFNHTGSFTEWSTLFKGGFSGMLFNSR